MTHTKSGINMNFETSYRKKIYISHVPAQHKWTFSYNRYSSRVQIQIFFYARSKDWTMRVIFIFWFLNNLMRVLDGM